MQPNSSEKKDLTNKHLKEYISEQNNQLQENYSGGSPIKIGEKRNDLKDDSRNDSIIHQFKRRNTKKLKLKECGMKNLEVNSGIPSKNYRIYRKSSNKSFSLRKKDSKSFDIKKCKRNTSCSRRNKYDNVEVNKKNSIKNLFKRTKNLFIGPSARLSTNDYLKRLASLRKTSRKQSRN